MNNVRASDGTFACHPPIYKTVVRHCGVCGTQLTFTNHRDVKRKNYCSRRCNALAGHRTETLKFRNAKRICKWCNEIFVATKSMQRYCSKRCGLVAHSFAYKERCATPEGFLKRLMRSNHRRLGLSCRFLLRLYERQNGRCAISGVPLTTISNNGHVLTNVSIDRINSNKGYSKDNVQLVCHIVNVMKHNMTLTELVEWCWKVIEHTEK